MPPPDEMALEWVQDLTACAESGSRMKVYSRKVIRTRQVVSGLNSCSELIASRYHPLSFTSLSCEVHATEERHGGQSRGAFQRYAFTEIILY